MKETKVICPICGTEIAIAEHEHTVKNATVIGKDSGLGTVVLDVAKPGRTGKTAEPAVTPKASRAEDRLAALKAAGVDTSNLFAMYDARGKSMIARLLNGVLATVPEDDPIFLAIKNGGTIPNYKLFRRHVTAQTFRMLTAVDWRTKRLKGFTQALHDLGYEYSWKMMVEELRVQAILFEKDKENYNLRNLWFNADVLKAMCSSYIKELNSYIDGLTVRHCKGIPYKRFAGRDIFVSDIANKIIAPLQVALWNINRAKSPKELYLKAVAFNRLRVKLAWDTKQDPVWVDAYKGCGAYFTMKNLIMFSGLRIKVGNNAFISTERSLAYLDRKSWEYRHEGWRLHAMMKKLLEDNNLDPAKKLAEWRSNK